MLNSNEIKEVRSLTGWSDGILNYIGTMEEAMIYMRANLQEAVVGGIPALIRTDIDWAAFNCRKEWLRNKLANYDEWQDYNNADLIGEGLPPRDANGDPYELHHIGQLQDSPLAELTWQEHMGDGNNRILHRMGAYSIIDRRAFESEKGRYWQSRFAMFSPDQLKEIYGNE